MFLRQSNAILLFSFPMLCSRSYAAPALSSAPTSESPGEARNLPVRITDSGERLRVEIGGKLFTEYYYKNVPRPFLYPIISAAGDAMTRNYPMKDVEGEPRDHVHHRSLWFTHGAVNGQDFWGEKAACGKIVHDAFVAVASGATSGVIESKNKWVAANGEIVCEDASALRFMGWPGATALDFDVTLHASHGAVTLGDTKEGSMAIRVAPSMQLEKGGQGHIVTSEGKRDGKAWGARADWCDYYGPVNGKTVGVAIFDHPQNPHHPTWWHARGYGLFAANATGVHDFEKAPKGTGDIVIPAGQSATFRYRFYFHLGDEQHGQVAERYREYVESTPAAETKEAN